MWTPFKGKKSPETAPTTGMPEESRLPAELQEQQRASAEQEAGELVRSLDEEIRAVADDYNEKFTDIEGWRNETEDLKEKLGLDSAGEPTAPVALDLANEVIAKAKELLTAYKKEALVIYSQEQFKGEKGAEFLDKEKVKQDYSADLEKLIADFIEKGKLPDKWQEQGKIKEILENFNISPDDFELMLEASRNMTADALKQEDAQKEWGQRLQGTKWEKFGDFLQKAGKKFGTNMAAGMAISAGVGAVGLTGGIGLAAVAAGMAGWRELARRGEKRWQDHRYRQRIDKAISNKETSGTTEKQEILGRYQGNLIDILQANQVDKLREQKEGKAKIKDYETLRQDYIEGKIDKDKLRAGIVGLRENYLNRLRHDVLPQEEKEELEQNLKSLQAVLMTEQGLEWEKGLHSLRQEKLPSKEEKAKGRTGRVAKELVASTAYGTLARVAYQLPYIGRALAAYGGLSLGKTAFEATFGDDEKLKTHKVKRAALFGAFALGGAGVMWLTGEARADTGGEETVDGWLNNAAHWLEEKGKPLEELEGKAKEVLGFSHGQEAPITTHPSESQSMKGDKDKVSEIDELSPKKPEDKFNDERGVGGTGQGVSPNEKTMGGGHGEPHPEAVRPTHFEDTIDSTGMKSAHDSIWRSTREIFLQHSKELGYDPSKGVAVEQWAETQTANAVAQLTKDQGGDLADLVHGPDITGKGDKVSIDIIDGKPHLKFEATSGIAPGYLPEASDAPTQVQQVGQRITGGEVGQAPSGGHSESVTAVESQSFTGKSAEKILTPEQVQEQRQLLKDIEAYNENLPPERRYDYDFEQAERDIRKYMAKHPEDWQNNAPLREVWQKIEPDWQPPEAATEAAQLPAQDAGAVEATKQTEAPTAESAKQVGARISGGEVGEAHGAGVRPGEATRVEDNAPVEPISAKKEDEAAKKPDTVEAGAAQKEIAAKFTVHATEIQLTRQDINEMDGLINNGARRLLSTEASIKGVAEVLKSNEQTARETLAMMQTAKFERLGELNAEQLERYDRVGEMITASLVKGGTVENSQRIVHMAHLDAYLDHLRKLKGYGPESEIGAPGGKSEGVSDDTTTTAPAEQGKQAGVKQDIKTDDAQAPKVVDEEVSRVVKDQPESGPINLSDPALTEHSKQLAQELSRGFLRGQRPEQLTELTTALARDLGLEQGHEKLFTNWLSGKDGVLKKDDLDGLLAEKGKLNLEAFGAKLTAFEQLAESKKLPGESWEPRILRNEKGEEYLANVRIEPKIKGMTPLETHYQIDIDGDGKPESTSSVRRISELMGVEAGADALSEKRAELRQLLPERERVKAGDYSLVRNGDSVLIRAKKGAESAMLISDEDEAEITRWLEMIKSKK